MLCQTTFADLVGQTYDAAMGQRDWSAVLAQLLPAFGASCVALSRRGGPVAGTIAVGCDPACIQLYEAHYHQLDPVRPLMSRLPAGSAFDDRALVPRRELERGEFYNDFLAHWGMHGALSWYHQGAEGQVATLKIVRSRRQPSFGREEVRLLRLLAPHLGRAQRVEQRLKGIAARPAEAAPHLSRRERECLQAIAGGASSKMIARRLAISAHTVNEYIEGAIRKLGAVNRTGAVATALGLGLLGAEAPAVQENR